MKINATIGVYNSGISGLTVLRELTRLMPGEKYSCFGDLARAPLRMPFPARVIDFMHQTLWFFAARWVKMAYMPAIPWPLGTGRRAAVLPISAGGMKETRTKTIGVKPSNRLIPLCPQTYPKFMPLIEQGKLSGRIIKGAVREYLQPPKEARVNYLIFGCTHTCLLSRLSDISWGQESF